MPLKTYKRPSGVYYIRGKHHGQVVDESARTRNSVEAEAIRERRERQIFEDVILGRPKAASFAEAAIHYLNAEGEARYLEPILGTLVKFDGRVMRFGEIALNDIDEALIYELARTLKPNAGNATRIRSVFTPVLAVLNRATRYPKLFAYAGIHVERPETVAVRADWKKPDEIEWWLERCKHLAPLITAYVGTGARAGELLKLQWQDVSPDVQVVTLWEKDTKAETLRSLDIQERVRACWPAKSKGHVFLNSEGKPWSDSRTINTFLWRITEAETRKAADRAEHQELSELKRLCRTLPIERRPNREYRALLLRVAERVDVPRLHLHSLRHTWATWAYAVTRDIAWVKQMGGWATAELVHRYMHAGKEDLAARVRAHGWNMREEATSILMAAGRKLESDS